MKGCAYSLYNLNLSCATSTTMTTPPAEDAKSKDAIDQPATTERIFIGGLHPKRLSLDEVLTRFPAEIIVQERPPNVDPRYAHLTVTTKDAAPERSPLATLQSLFHNVKWKGCKLIVQAAKPHFLTRLAAERQSWQGGEAVPDAKDPNISPPETDPPGSSKSSVQRRFYRIRQQHGKPAWKVDTHPYQVEQAADFGKLVHHVRLKRSKAKAGRAVHLRFLEADDTRSRVNAKSAPISLADDSSATSSSSPTAGGYAWSDDEDSMRDSMDKKVTSRAAANRTKGGSGDTYAWSEDEDDKINNARVKQSPLTVPRAVQHDMLLDEFAAGSEEEDNAMSDDVNDDGSFEGEAPETVDLEADQTANLKILQQLFPDMAPKPAKINATTTNARYNPSGQMMRYDPTQASSKLLEQTRDEEVTDSSEKADASGDDGDDENNNDDTADKAESVHEEGSKASEGLSHEQEREESETETGNGESGMEVAPSVEQGDVYREKDLEHVFRQARESHGRPAVMVTVAMESAKAAPTDSGFSFGFDLPAEENATSPVQGFSFGFGLNHDSPSQGNSNIPSAPTNEKRAMDVGDNEAHVRSSPRKRRRLQTSYTDLARYVNAYLLETNEGEHIAADLKNFREDPATQEHWNQQRQRLTTDWKSKRKQALARQQKKSR